MKLVKLCFVCTLPLQNPIGCRARRTAALRFKIVERNSNAGSAATFEYGGSDADMANYGDPAAGAAVIKACVELVGARDVAETVCEEE